MSKHYWSKSALLLSLLATATSASLVQAEETTGSTTAANTNVVSQPAATAPTVEATPATNQPVASDTSTVTESQPPAETTTANSDATSTAAQPVAADTNDTVAPQEGQSVDVRILSTTDLHTNLVNYDYYQDKESQKIGLAKTAVLIDNAKAENSNVVLVDNGDLIQGTPLGTYKALVDRVEKGEQHPMYAALGALGFDASTLGNHEFNYGLDYLKNVISTAGLPVVNANVIDATSNQPLFKQYEIITKSFKDADGKQVNLKIGITGIVPPQILNWDKANLEGKVTVRDSVKALEELVPKICQAGADIVLVLSHSGIGDDEYHEGEENVGYQIAGIKGVDAVVTGHSHAEFPSGDDTGFYEKYPNVDGVNGTINGTPVTMAGKYGDHLGVIDLGLTYTNGKWKVTKSHAEIREIDTKSNIADPRVIAIADKAHQGTIAYVRKQVGTTTAPINSYFALVKDDPSVQIVNNAQLWYAKQELAGTPEAELPLLSAAAPFKAGTRGDATAYTDIPAGPIAIKNVADLYLYDNVTAILKVTGADLKEWLEMSAGQFNQIVPTDTKPQSLVNMEYRTYNFDVIDGLTYEFDVTQPNKYDRNGNLVNASASRVRNLKYNGQAIDPNQEFMVVTNNYRATGNFPGVKKASINRLLNLENRQAIINYILAEKTINPSADNNWRFADTIKGLDLRFQTADSAKGLVAGSQELVYLNPSTTMEGFGDYRFVYTEPTTTAQTPTVDTNDDQVGDTSRTTLDPKTQAAIHSMVAKAYAQTLASTANEKQANMSSQNNAKALPNTGETSSLWMTILGIVSLGFIAKVKNRKEN
ncbi:bifunctional 2',3'-cyclic-nucleotide 2'-phosphodiesterase/3'-nucleotidase [Streptococcus thoraltensis]|uniref:bifunctional 2',3'-cyclic-nucleotide 2'-phosphodiesterase/3'-nucleotidase n=1 Tax=Streptococcus thoraltensis TaxID=55085 RepID=UPI0003632511|nr:bifunctional 2',3'-cyclic-nucleotide 2'-phosphodiesterase/3'-nucleotidase [Streptococcus thoraltensis]